MNKAKSLKVLSILLSIVSIFGIFKFVQAIDVAGKIEVNKSATKVSEVFDETNLLKGRYANVTLNVRANPYNENQTVYSKLDIVLVLDSSGSMAYGPNGAQDRTRPKRIDAAKNAGTEFINTMMDSGDAVQIGLVDFSREVNRTQALTSNKETALDFLGDDYSAGGGTNLQSGIMAANELLQNGRNDAKKLVIILTDGIPTFFNYNGKRFGTGNSDAGACIRVNFKNECLETRKPSDAAKIELDNLKKAYVDADVYTITLGNESEAASTLSQINPADETTLHKYKNLTALNYQELAQEFRSIASVAKDVVATDAIVTDIIPVEFELTDESREALEEQGVRITNEANGETKLVWNVGELRGNINNELTYIVRAKDEYHGSIYTNKVATLNATVEDSNPYYSETNITETFRKPTVEIPAVLNDDHYNNNSSYISYQNIAINGSSILTNDLLSNKISINSVVEDIIVVNTNENVVKTLDNKYEIFNDGIKQGVLEINADGTFTFIPEADYYGEVSFTYHIKSTFTRYEETAYVLSNDAVVTLKINEIPKTAVRGIKTWADDNNRDGIRPNSVTVILKKVGIGTNVKVAEVTITAEDKWSYVFENLPQYESGHENDKNYLIQYQVEEVSVNDYIATYDGYNITNTHTPETMNITVTKTWNDDNNNDGKRPESITVKLYKQANQELVEVPNSTAILEGNDTNNWTYTYNNLLKYENGREIVYVVREVGLDQSLGYEATYDDSNYKIINTRSSETIEISGTKTWDDDNNRDGIRPASIEVILTGKVGETVLSRQTITVSEDTKWGYIFENLPKYNNGSVISYTISENDVQGYSASINGNNITNTHTPEAMDITVTKAWNDDNNNDGKRPENITVTLYKGTGDNKVEVSSVTLSSRNATTSTNVWSYTFEDLLKKENGQNIVYTISENEVDGYTGVIEGSAENGFVITNSHTNITRSITVEKIWQDSNNNDGKRPQNITINLYKQGEQGLVEVPNSTAIIEGNDTNNWTYTYNNLLKYENGSEIVYVVREVGLDQSLGYEATYDDSNYKIINTRSSETIEISGTKTWDDDNNRDGIRPASIEVILTGKVGETVLSRQTITVSEDTKWGYIFENLPKYSNGSVISYTISESDVQGYSASINGYNITNTHTPNKITISGEKVWSDADNQDGIRPESITVILNKTVNNTTSVVDRKIVSVDNNGEWTFTFEDLYEKENGQTIIYTLDEVLVDGYSKSIDNYQITNTHIPETIDYTLVKNWEDYDNNDGIRPDSITIKVYNDVALVDTIIINSENNWTAKTNKLPKYSNGELINYTFVEDEVLGYESTIDNPIVDNNGNNTVVINNVHELETINITINKVWNDANNQDGIRPDSVVVNIYADDEEFESVVLTEDDNWTYVLDGLQKYNNGREIVYSIVEEEVLGYTSSYNGYTITNTHIPETIEFNLVKNWEDYDNNDGIRPDSITIKVYNDVALVDTVIINSENKWVGITNELPKYNNGELINYTFVEEEVLGYESTIEVNESNVVITNTHELDTIDIIINKVWNDDSYENNRPNAINVIIYADGEEFEAFTLTEEENWVFTIDGLQKYNNGEEIVYTIEEEPIENYEVKYDGYTIINTYIEPEEITPPNTGIYDSISSDTYLELIILLLGALGITYTLKKREN